VPGLLAVIAIYVPFSLPAADWPMWGGTPQRNMANTTEKNLPATWDITTGKNIKWVAQLGSQSYGNPVVAAGKVLVGTNNHAERQPKAKGDKSVVMCFSEKDGAFLWQMTHDKLPAGRVNDWPRQGICSSPCVEGKYFYYVSNRCELVCGDLEGFLDGKNDGPFKDEKLTDKTDGDVVWKLDMIAELGVFPHNLATSSPAIDSDLIFLVTSNGVDESHITIPNPEAPSFLAVHKSTGKVAWSNKGPREGILHGQWSSPAIGVMGGVKQVVFPGGDGALYSFLPETGELLWKFQCNPKDAVYKLGGQGTRNEIIATPVIHGDRVYISVGQDPEHGEGVGHLYAVDGTKRGDITDKGGAVWHNGEVQRAMSTVALHDGILYHCDLSGTLRAIDAETGKTLWHHDLEAAVWGSPYYVDGKVYIGNEDGVVTVFAAGREEKVLAKVSMESSVYTTPVAAGGVLFVANRERLYAIQEGAQSDPEKVK
jgi:outer membrane protein assembly factor BamB